MAQVITEPNQRADPHDGADQIDDKKASLRQFSRADDIGIGGAHEGDVTGGDQGQDAVLVQQVVDLLLVPVFHMGHQPMIHLGMAEEAPLHIAEPSANKGGHDQQRDHPEGQYILINEHAGEDQQAVAGQKGGWNESVFQYQKRQNHTADHESHLRIGKGVQIVIHKGVSQLVKLFHTCKLRRLAG